MFSSSRNSILLSDFSPSDLNPIEFGEREIFPNWYEKWSKLLGVLLHALGRGPLWLGSRLLSLGLGHPHIEVTPHLNPCLWIDIDNFMIQFDRSYTRIVTIQLWNNNKSDCEMQPESNMQQNNPSKVRTNVIVTNLIITIPALAYGTPTIVAMRWDTTNSSTVRFSCFRSVQKLEEVRRSFGIDSVLPHHH